MKLKSILITAGLLLAAFGLGVVVGARITRRPATSADGPLAAPAISTQESPGPPPVPASTASAVPAGNNAPSCVDIRNTQPLEGKNACVTGLVLRVYSSHAGNTFLDFCQDYRSCPFTSVIFASDKAKFGDLESLQGRRVEIRGEVVAFQGRAEIIVHDPRQVRSAD